MFDNTQYRLSNAWRGLTGNLPTRTVEKVVEVAILGEPHRASLYRVGHVPLYAGGGLFSWSIIETQDGVRRGVEYFQTCEQAHTARPGEAVTKVDALRVAGRYLIAQGDRLVEVKVGSKPKKAKGKRA